jgi:hypothetical protein
MATSAIRIGEACVFFSGVLFPNDFFHGLKRTRTPSGSIFHKRGEVFTQYPEELTLDADPEVFRCRKDITYLGPWPVDAQEFLGPLRVEAGYVRDLHLYPLDITLAQEGTVKYALDDLTNQKHWRYTYVIQAKGVRLTDKLVVSFYVWDGTKVGEFIVDLAGKTGLW